MLRERLLKDPFVTTVIGLGLYLTIWLIVLPVLADTSAPLAVLSLTVFTGMYCFIVADLKGFNAPMWATIGGLTGIFELGLLPVILLGLLRARSPEAEIPREALSE